MESIISSYSGTLITWSDNAIYNNISVPIFSRMGSIVNAIFMFRPVLVLIVMFGLCIGLFFRVFSDSKSKKNKSLENK